MVFKFQYIGVALFCLFSQQSALAEEVPIGSGPSDNGTVSQLPDRGQDPSLESRKSRRDARCNFETLVWLQAISATCFPNEESELQTFLTLWSQKHIAFRTRNSGHSYSEIETQFREDISRISDKKELCDPEVEYFKYYSSWKLEYPESAQLYKKELEDIFTDDPDPKMNECP